MAHIHTRAADSRKVYTQELRQLQITVDMQRKQLIENGITPIDSPAFPNGTYPYFPFHLLWGDMLGGKVGGRGVMGGVGRWARGG